MTMTKKDYELLARVLRDTFSSVESQDVTDGIALVAINLSRALESDNDKFDRAKFYKAMQA